MNAPVDGKARCRLHGELSTGAKTEEDREHKSERAEALWAERKRLQAIAREVECAIAQVAMEQSFVTITRACGSNQKAQ
jgi:aryl-alcohol dehydrogenase-like predicted oxidoreductase